MSNSDERLQYYTLLAGKEDDTGTLNGNHQTLHNLLPGATIRDYDLKRQFGYEMTGWNNASDGLYQGIKVYCVSGETLKAPFKCKITNVNTDDNKITLRKDDVEYWYDGNGGTKRDTEVTIANAVLISGFSEGDTINDGQEFAKTTAENVNFHIYIDTDGYGWDYIDLQKDQSLTVFRCMKLSQQRLTVEQASLAVSSVCRLSMSNSIRHYSSLPIF